MDREGLSQVARISSLVRSTLMAVVLVSLAASEVSAERCDCSQPISSGSAPTAVDCLLILRLAVGAPDTTCGECADIACRPSGGSVTTATDALRCLKAAVGDQSALSCASSTFDGVLTGFEWKFRSGANMAFGPAQFDVPLSPNIVFQSDLIWRCVGGGQICRENSECGLGDECAPTCDGTGECEFIAKRDPRRCITSMHVVCTSDADCPNGESCSRFFGVPTPVFHPAPICRISRVVDPKPALINMDTGEVTLPLLLSLRVWLGLGVSGCPNCGTLAEDLQVGDTGTCITGLRDGEACVVHGKSEVGTTSWDCPPSPTDNITGEGLTLPFDMTTGRVERTAKLLCGGALFEGASPDPTTGARGFCLDSMGDCATNADCMRCSESTAIACTSNSDCSGECLSAPDQPITCGAYCHCGTCSQDHSLVCASHADCGEGNVCETSRLNRTQTFPNICSDSICGAVVPGECCQDDSDPRCLLATEPQAVCSENPEFECGSEDTCARFGYGACNTISGGFRCLGNRYEVVGEASPRVGLRMEPVLVSATCAGETAPEGAPGIFDQVGRTPGPVAGHLPSVFTACVCGNGTIECDEPCDDGTQGSASCTANCQAIP